MGKRYGDVLTQHRMRWGAHEELLSEWKRQPPGHPENPRYIGSHFEIEGRYSLFERVVNVFRARGLLDAPPADYKWAVVTVYYKAPEDVMERFSRLGTQGA